MDLLRMRDRASLRQAFLDWKGHRLGVRELHCLWTWAHRAQRLKATRKRHADELTAGRKRAALSEMRRHRKAVVWSWSQLHLKHALRRWSWTARLKIDEELNRRQIARKIVLNGKALR